MVPAQPVWRVVPHSLPGVDTSVCEANLQAPTRHPLGKVGSHVPCHSRVQNVGKKTAETLQPVPDSEVRVVEGCSGHHIQQGTEEAGMKQAEIAHPPHSSRQGLRADRSTETVE